MTVLSDVKNLKVEMKYDVHKKALVPVPSSILKGTKIMDFPVAFRTEEGYRELEKKKSMMIPKAELRFKKRAQLGQLKNAYFIEVLPTNKKSKIDLVYHPSLPATGWAEVDITFISKIPGLNGYEIDAVLKK